MVPRGGTEPPTLRFSASLRDVSCPWISKQPCEQRLIALIQSPSGAPSRHNLNFHYVHSGPPQVPTGSTARHARQRAQIRHMAIGWQAAVHVDLGLLPVRRSSREVPMPQVFFDILGRRLAVYLQNHPVFRLIAGDRFASDCTHRQKSHMTYCFANIICTSGKPGPQLMGNRSSRTLENATFRLSVAATSINGN